ncbi:MAG: class I SAM-dependent methyltransferase [Acidimicrobiia bacterium]|nr:class I SAM-dependent methyltransferase [Acidimicrobiia bacterium]
MADDEDNRIGFSVVGGRDSKAAKIAAVLAVSGRPLTPGDDVLDLGCGSGEIAAQLAQLSRVVCADRADQRVSGSDLPFREVSDLLPFGDESFDVVISNHVIEHTADPVLHLSETRRVLRPNGVLYLATPNRVWPWEPHARLPVLHYLPWRLFFRLGRALGRLHEPVRLLSLPRLRALTRDGFELSIWHDRILKEPDRFGLSLPRWVTRVLSFVPLPVLQKTAAIQPTLIVLLSPR